MKSCSLFPAVVFFTMILTACPAGPDSSSSPGGTSSSVSSAAVTTNYSIVYTWYDGDYSFGRYSNGVIITNFNDATYQPTIMSMNDHETGWYAVGALSTEYPAFWQDSTLVILSNISLGMANWLTAMDFNGPDYTASGYSDMDGLGVYRAFTVQNGSQTILPSIGYEGATAHDIVLVNGECFTAGLVFTNSRNYFAVWSNTNLLMTGPEDFQSDSGRVSIVNKDGKPVLLATVLSNSTLYPARWDSTGGWSIISTDSGSVNDIIGAKVINGDLYAYGYAERQTGLYQACYWKNGVLNWLGAITNSEAYDLALAGDTVIACGRYTDDDDGIAYPAAWEGTNTVTLKGFGFFGKFTGIKIRISGFTLPM